MSRRPSLSSPLLSLTGTASTPYTPTQQPTAHHSSSTPHLMRTPPPHMLPAGLPQGHARDQPPWQCSSDQLLLELLPGILFDLRARNHTAIPGNRHYLNSRILLRLSYLILAIYSYVLVSEWASANHEQDLWDLLSRAYLIPVCLVWVPIRQLHSLLFNTCQPHYADGTLSPAITAQLQQLTQHTGPHITQPHVDNYLNHWTLVRWYIPIVNDFFLKNELNSVNRDLMTQPTEIPELLRWLALNILMQDKIKNLVRQGNPRYQQHTDTFTHYPYFSATTRTMKDCLQKYAQQHYYNHLLSVTTSTDDTTPAIQHAILRLTEGVSRLSRPQTQGQLIGMSLAELSLELRALVWRHQRFACHAVLPYYPLYCLTYLSLLAGFAATVYLPVSRDFVTASYTHLSAFAVSIVFTLTLLDLGIRHYHHQLKPYAKTIAANAARNFIIDLKSHGNIPHTFDSTQLHSDVNDFLTHLIKCYGIKIVGAGKVSDVTINLLRKVEHLARCWSDLLLTTQTESRSNRPAQRSAIERQTELEDLFINPINKNCLTLCWQAMFKANFNQASSSLLTLLFRRFIFSLALTQQVGLHLECDDQESQVFNPASPHSLAP